jgi:hypothetical protein
MNEETLKNFIQKNRDIIEKSLSAQIYDVAVVFRELFGGKYACTKSKSRIWFVFNGVRWVTTELGPYLDISDDFVRLYELYAQEIRASTTEQVSVSRTSCPARKEIAASIVSGGAGEAPQEKIKGIQLSTDVLDCLCYLADHVPKAQQTPVVKGFQELWRHYDALATAERQMTVSVCLNAIQKLIELLKTVTFKEPLVRECYYLFYREGFVDLLDRKENLYAFNDGVFDSETATFRPGRPDDYMFLSVGIEFDDATDIQMTKFKELRAAVLRRRKRSSVAL